jgi:pimeloyl-ACP methyl ester carboxylesterase/cell wall-associated NlpC family hydrolase
MSYIQVNGAQIHYDLFAGPRCRPGRPPVILIHGAAGTGASAWSEVAPLLARHYRVIVPDCRGHGRSTNPGHGYAFREMAADLIELVRRLGHARAHWVGHGHGGRIALCVLLEYPEVVQTCTLQGTPAQVTQELAHTWLDLFDPYRLATHAPERAEALMALHSSMHGAQYWRELLQATLEETLLEPGYTSDALALVRRPVLVIQGALDEVFGSDSNGRSLARRIPGAEAWFPSSAGHDVQRDQLWPWCEHVLDFLARRGDDANNALDSLARACFGDPRTTVFSVRAEESEPVADRARSLVVAPPAGVHAAGQALEGEVWWDEPAPLRLVGQVLEDAQREAALAAVGAVAWRSASISDEIQVLLDDRTPWALANVVVADLRRLPDSNAERISQLLPGEAVRLLQENDGWARVWAEADGYVGWVEMAALWPCPDAAAAHAFSGAADALVAAELAPAYPRPRRSVGPVGKVPFGTVLPLIARRRGWAELLLPDGRSWWLAQTDLLPLADRPAQDAAGIARALELMRRSVGAPYLPGGRTPFGFDSVGLAQAFLRLLGVPAPRSLEQLCQAGQVVAGRPEPGDLLFFAHEPAQDEERYLAGGERISHVAISLGGLELLQAGGGALCVNCLSLDPAQTPAAAWLHRHRLGVRRYLGG